MFSLFTEQQQTLNLQSDIKGVMHRHLHGSVCYMICHHEAALHTDDTRLMLKGKVRQSG